MARGPTHIWEGGGQGCHFEAAFGVRVLRGLGSQYHYSALAQEFSGAFWVCGRTLGRQYIHLDPDIAETDLLLAIGWNGMQSHQIPQAPRQLQRIAKDPDKLLIVIDPRVSETAKIADMHLPIRPGTDALLLKAMIAIILDGRLGKQGLHGAAYLRFRAGQELCFRISTPAPPSRTCRLDFDQVREVCHLFATRKSSLRNDLGIYMGRHSGLSSYLIMILQAICGRIGVPGGRNHSRSYDAHRFPYG